MSPSVHLIVAMAPIIPEAIESIFFVPSVKLVGVIHYVCLFRLQLLLF